VSIRISRDRVSSEEPSVKNVGRKRLQTYDSPGITVTFDPNLCGHSADCLNGLPAVFDVERKRWIRPEAASADEVAAQIRRCPSGALQFHLPADRPPES
jgi:uncharacterized Fe-S cluster protein YjdI